MLHFKEYRDAELRVMYEKLRNNEPTLRPTTMVLILLNLLYIISPLDILPEYFITMGVLPYVDDIAMTVLFGSMVLSDIKEMLFVINNGMDAVRERYDELIHTVKPSSIEEPEEDREPEETKTVEEPEDKTPYDNEPILEEAVVEDDMQPEGDNKIDISGLIDLADEFDSKDEDADSVACI